MKYEDLFTFHRIVIIQFWASTECECLLEVKTPTRRVASALKMPRKIEDAFQPKLQRTKESEVITTYLALQQNESVINIVSW